MRIASPFKSTVAGSRRGRRSWSRPRSWIACSPASRIRVWREHRGMTAKVLAEEAGIAQPFLSQIETGKREGTVDTLRSLADALGVTIDDLVG